MFVRRLPSWFVGATLAGLVAAAGTSACTPQRLVSVADLQRYGTKRFDQPKAEVVRATATALKTLGYEVTVADEASGRVKTSPKVVVIGAVRTSSYTAVGYQNALAWSFDVSSTPDGGALVRATPRAYSNGQEDTHDRWNADYMEQTIESLFREIASDLPPQPPTDALAAKGNARGPKPSEQKPSELKPSETKPSAPADRRRAKGSTK